MSSRPIEFAVLKYFPDPARREARNVGLVLVASDGDVRLRLRGYDGEKVDGRRVRSAVGDLENYRQWVEFLRWRTTMPDFTLEDILLNRPGDSYLVEAGGRTLFGDFDFDDLADDLYSQLVEPPELPSTAPVKPPSFEERVDQLLAEAELIGDDSFHRNFELPVGNEERRFHYAWVNGSTAAGQRVPAASTDGLDALLFRFQHLDPSFRRVLFVDDFDLDFERNLRTFAEEAHDPMVFVPGSSKATDVRAAFTGKS